MKAVNRLNGRLTKVNWYDWFGSQIPFRHFRVYFAMAKNITCCCSYTLCHQYSLLHLQFRGYLQTLLVRRTFYACDDNVICIVLQDCINNQYYYQNMCWTLRVLFEKYWWSLWNTESFLLILALTITSCFEDRILTVGSVQVFGVTILFEYYTGHYTFTTI